MSQKEKRSLKEKVREDVEKVMRDYLPAPLDNDTQKELSEIWIFYKENL